MTVVSTSSDVTYYPNGVATQFPVDFRFIEKTDLVVTRIDSSGLESTLTLNIDYTVSGGGSADGGLVQTVGVPLDGGSLVIAREMDVNQLTDLRNQGAFFAEVHEDAFDKLTMLIQQAFLRLRGLLGTVRAPFPESIPALPSAAGRAGKILSFDSAGNPVAIAPSNDSATALALDLANHEDYQKGAGIIGWIINAPGAVGRWLRDKVSERVSIFDFMAAEQIADYRDLDAGSLDHTAAYIAAMDYLTSKGGGILHMPAGILRATRLPIRSHICIKGEYGATFIRCVDPDTLDAGVGHGSFFRKPDDGQRVFRASFEDLFICSAISGLAASQDVFSKVMGVNICGCERTFFKNVTFAGFGMGGLVLARAEAGAEGLGFVNTTHDGNYNSGINLGFASCGKYNSDTAAMWFKYKANSNKFYGVFGKPVEFLVTFRRSNDNLINGCTAESSVSIGGFRELSAGNTIQGARAEILSGHAYDFDSDASANMVLSGYYTGVTGNHANNIENTIGNYVVDAQMNWQGAGNFPPASSASTNHSQRTATFRAINGDNILPLYIKARAFDGATHPAVRMWNSRSNVSSGDILGALDVQNSDATAGAAGVSGAFRFVAEDASGGTAATLSTGTGSTLTERLRVRANGATVLHAPASAGTLTVNGTMTFELVSNTQLRVTVRGGDGVTRSSVLTLA